MRIDASAARFSSTSAARRRPATKSLTAPLALLAPESVLDWAPGLLDGAVQGSSTSGQLDDVEATLVFDERAVHSADTLDRERRGRHWGGHSFVLIGGLARLAEEAQIPKALTRAFVGVVLLGETPGRGSRLRERRGSG